MGLASSPATQANRERKWPMSRVGRAGKPISFRGLTFEEAVGAAVRVKPPKKKSKPRAKKRSKKAAKARKQN